MVLQLFSRKEAARKNKRKGSGYSLTDRERFDPAEPLQLDPDPLSQCVQLERYGHVLARCKDWREHPEIDRACESARKWIDEMFSIVPEGFASLAQVVNDHAGCPEVTVDTNSFLMGRYAVTNAQFQKFVDSGGYEQLDLWPNDIWPHLIDFKDLTGQRGPRFWQDGRPSKHLLNHPVVGICQYEAAAYAKWAGFRLPTEAEWQMAATWRIRSEANVLRRYPWGDSLDTRRCNIWASGIGDTTPVDAYPEGASPNQVLQLVGNVWEWTACDYKVTGEDGGMVVSDMRLSSIRGGAFDTYFPMQATSLFRTGLVSLARVHNTGFRCALDLGA